MKTWINKALPYCAHIKRFALAPTKELETMEPTKRRRIILILISFAALNLAYSLFSLYTLLSFGLVILGIGVYAKMGLQDIRKKGLIAYLPARYQKILLHRSLFDVLCDMWFIPKVSIYAKAFVSPFFIKIDPSEAIHQLKELPIGARKVFLTKGVVNAMPSLLKNSLLPQNDLAAEESSDVSSEVDRQHSHPSRNAELKENTSGEKSDLEFFLNDVSRKGSRDVSMLDSLRISKIDQSSLHNRLTQTSTDDDGLVNHNFSMSQQLEVKKTLPSFADINPLRTHLDYQDGPKNPKGYGHSDRIPRNKIKNVDSKSTTKLHRAFLHDVDSDLRTEVLNSSKTASVKLNKSLEISEKWDKLELFTRKRREKLLMRQKNGGNPAGQKVQLKGPLQTLHNIATLLSKDALMNKLEDKSLMKIFLASSLILLIQFSLSKKTRLWCYNTFHILMYITGVALSTGSFGLLIMKLRNKYRIYKEEQQRAAALLELKDKEETE